MKEIKHKDVQHSIGYEIESYENGIVLEQTSSLMGINCLDDNFETYDMYVKRYAIPNEILNKVDLTNLDFRQKCNKIINELVDTNILPSENRSYICVKMSMSDDDEIYYECKLTGRVGFTLTDKEVSEEYRDGKVFAIAAEMTGKIVPKLKKTEVIVEILKKSENAIVGSDRAFNTGA